jgi:hypothetical protein
MVAELLDADGSTAWLLLEAPNGIGVSVGATVTVTVAVAVTALAGAVTVTAGADAAGAPEHAVNTVPAITARGRTQRFMHKLYSTGHRP